MHWIWTLSEACQRGNKIKIDSIIDLIVDNGTECQFCEKQNFG